MKTLQIWGARHESNKREDDTEHTVVESNPLVNSEDGTNFLTKLAKMSNHHCGQARF
jgi:hypothetical protein